MRARSLAGCIAAAAVLAAAAAPEPAPAEAARLLHEREVALAAQLAHNDFQQPLVLYSEEAGDALRGDVFARLPQPFAVLAGSLARPAQWCEVLILHLNVKRCDAGASGPAVNVGRKFDQPLEQTQLLEFADFAAAATPQFLRVQMAAPTGPLGTRDYRIELEAVPTEGDRSFVHFRYSFAANLVGRIAMQTYLHTAGSDKIGFSAAAPAQASAPAGYVGGARGAVERNAMRYYLAISAYLGSLAAPADERVEQRLRAWFDATERYPAQLHEIDRDDYLAMKRHELQRQSSPAR